MARSDCAALLASTGLPVVYWKWPDGSAPEYPCIRYASEGERAFRADGRRWTAADEWSATLVSEWKDDASEQAVESVLDAAGIDYSKSADWRDRASGLHHVEYSFSMPR